MFGWLLKLKQEKKKKTVRAKTYVCKHCKLTCETCTTMFCWACYSNAGNSCPRCGKTNLMEKEQKKDTQTIIQKSA